MDNFQDIDFDTVQGIEREVLNLTTRIGGILDHLDDPKMNDLPPHTQEKISHLTNELQAAMDCLHSGMNSWINAIWHDLDQEEKIKLIEGEK